MGKASLLIHVGLAHAVSLKEMICLILVVASSRKHSYSSPFKCASRIGLASVVLFVGAPVESELNAVVRIVPTKPDSSLTETKSKMPSKSDISTSNRMIEGANLGYWSIPCSRVRQFKWRKIQSWMRCSLAVGNSKGGCELRGNLCS